MAFEPWAGEATAQSLDVASVGTHQLSSHPEGLSAVWLERAGGHSSHSSMAELICVSLIPYSFQHT